MARVVGAKNISEKIILKMVAEYYASGSSLRLVAKRHGVAHQTLKKYIATYQNHPWVEKYKLEFQSERVMQPIELPTQKEINKSEEEVFDLINEARSLNAEALRKLKGLLKTEKDIGRVTRIYEVSGNIAKLSVENPNPKKETTCDAVMKHYLEHATSQN